MLPSLQLASSVRREDYVDLVAALETSRGAPDQLRAILARHGITHVFLGERRGRVGYGINPLVPEAWLRASPDFTLLYQAGQAQVWGHRSASASDSAR